jgi:hypothetical protein
VDRVYLKEGRERENREGGSVEGKERQGDPRKTTISFLSPSIQNISFLSPSIQNREGRGRLWTADRQRLPVSRAMETTGRWGKMKRSLWAIYSAPYIGQGHTVDVAPRWWAAAGGGGYQRWC